MGCYLLWEFLISLPSIITSSSTFISDYYREAGLDVYGDSGNNSAAERQRRLKLKLSEIAAKLDLFNFGVRLYIIGKYDAAIELFEKFVVSYPSREVYNNLGMCYYQKAFLHYLNWKRQETARAPRLVFRMSAQIDPTSRIQSFYGTRGTNEKQSVVYPNFWTQN